MLNNQQPMTYDFYHQIKKGTTPKSAPTFAQTEKPQEKTAKYTCKICNYVYDPAIGDSQSNIAGVKFEDLLISCLCPICGTAKEHFEKPYNHPFLL